MGAGAYADASFVLRVSTKYSGVFDVPVDVHHPNAPAARAKKCAAELLTKLATLDGSSLRHIERVEFFKYTHEPTLVLRSIEPGHRGLEASLLGKVGEYDSDGIQDVVNVYVRGA